MDNLIWGDRSPIYSSLLASFKSFLLFCSAPIIPTGCLQVSPLHDRLMFCTWQKAQWLSPPISLNLSDFRDIIKPGILSSVPTHAKQHFFHSKEDFFGQGVLRHMEVDMGGIPPPPCIHDFFSESELPKERLCKWHHTHSFSLPFFPSNRMCRFQILLAISIDWITKV